MATARNNETVREVCAEMYKGVKDTFGNRLPIFNPFADRILSAHGREMAAKDKEIERLKAALKPVMEVDVPSVIRLPSIGEPKIIRDLYYAQNAVREAQRIMKEGETND